METKSLRLTCAVSTASESHVEGWTKLSEHHLLALIAAVSFNGRTHKVQVKPGVEGAKAFENEIRKMLQLPQEQEFDVSFVAALASLLGCIVSQNLRIRH